MKNKHLLEKENKAQEQNERLLVYRQILTSAPKKFLLDKKQDFIAKNSSSLINTLSLKDYGCKLPIQWKI